MIFAPLFVLVALFGLVGVSVRRNWPAVCWCISAILWAIMYINRYG